MKIIYMYSPDCSTMPPFSSTNFFIRLHFCGMCGWLLFLSRLVFLVRALCMCRLAWRPYRLALRLYGLLAESKLDMFVIPICMQCDAYSLL